LFPGGGHEVVTLNTGGSRKRYATPEVVVYGSLQTLTRAKGGTRGDGGGGKPTTRIRFTLPG